MILVVVVVGTFSALGRMIGHFLGGAGWEGGQERSLGAHSWRTTKTILRRQGFIFEAIGRPYFCVSRK